MSIFGFIQKSGFKILAMADLSACEYSVSLYLMNCTVSGLDDIVSTESELSELVGHDKKDVALALGSLQDKRIVEVGYSDQGQAKAKNPSLRMGFNLNVETWNVPQISHKAARQAVVYPFTQRRHALEIVPGGQSDASQSDSELNLVLEAFISGRDLDQAEIEENKASAELIVQAHSPGHVVHILKYFGQRIPSISLLASNWDHYQSLLGEETQQVDLSDARKKHEALDKQLIAKANEWLEAKDESRLSQEEVDLLKLLTQHRHPRRQLFWANKARSRYINLEPFFKENAQLMLAVTTSGSIIKNH